MATCTSTLAWSEYNQLSNSVYTRRESPSGGGFQPKPPTWNWEILTRESKRDTALRFTHGQRVLLALACEGWSSGNQSVYTSRALVDAGGLWSSRENMPVLKARLWSSVRSLRTVRKNAAFDRVLVAT